MFVKHEISIFPTADNQMSKIRIFRLERIDKFDIIQCEIVSIDSLSLSTSKFNIFCSQCSSQLYTNRLQLTCVDDCEFVF